LAKWHLGQTILQRLLFLAESRGLLNGSVSITSLLPQRLHFTEYDLNILQLSEITFVK